MNPDEFRNTTEIVKNFGAPGGSGEKLQKMLEDRAAKKENWVRRIQFLRIINLADVFDLFFQNVLFLQYFYLCLNNSTLFYAVSSFFSLSFQNFILISYLLYEIGCILATFACIQ